MTNFDRKLHDLLAEHDEALGMPEAEEGYYREVLSSFKGEGSELRVATWIGILFFGGWLIWCVIQFLRAESLQDQITYGVFAIMLNSAQIALKLWFNMRLNRRAVIREIRGVRLQLLSESP
ncbi:MAG: DUF6768 family protein [Pseudomonadota bacterium]